MQPCLDAGVRAAGYCLHPRLMLWSMLPVLLGGGLLAVVGWFFWEPMVAAMRAAMEQFELTAALLDWLSAQGADSLRVVLAPLLVVMLAVPLVVVLTLLLVAVSMMPAVVRLVAARRFPTLEIKRGAGALEAIGWALACTLAALLALVVSVPLWFIPPLVVLLPPLIWGWLTGRVLAFDALALHASADERRTVLRRLRWPLLAMGIFCGYLGALPSLLWAFGAATLVFAPLLLAGSVWLYTLVFGFAAAWFAHYVLNDLQRLRAETPS